MSRTRSCLLALSVLIAVNCTGEGSESQLPAEPTTTVRVDTRAPEATVTSTTTVFTQAEGCISGQASFKHLEACASYISPINSAASARYLYYTLARSPNPARVKQVTDGLKDRYQGQALEAVTQLAAGWPEGENVVELPRIVILMSAYVAGSEQVNFVTRETWVVRQGDKVLWQETGNYAVKMQEVPGLLTKKWVVTQITRS